MIAQIGEMGVWLRPAPAAKILGVSLSTLRNKARLWGIRVRIMPRTRGRRFHLEDVQRVATEAAQQAQEAMEEALRNPPPLKKGTSRFFGEPLREPRQPLRKAQT